MLILAAVVAVLTPATAIAQQPAGPVTLPPVTVTAQKEPADEQRLPVSISTITSATLEDAGITVVSDAAIYAPNVYFADFTARKLSNPRFRGIGSSPANPGVATYIDGVPQLNTNSSSIDLLDVDQIEFVRGPQSALFGRNALGGLINITSARPSLTTWTGSVLAPIGSSDARDVRGTVSGPVQAGKIGVALSLGYGRRNGFTTNDLTGHTLDDRAAFSGKGQLLWAPGGAWQARVIVAGERARDGDYALNDLVAIRKTPFHALRNFEGRTDRDVMSTTVETRRSGSRVGFSSSTGIVKWKTRDLTDLDYTPSPLITRDNTEKDVQFTQEIRLASAVRPVTAGSQSRVFKWQAGALVFHQNYKQDAINSFAPFLISPLLSVPVSQHSPESALDDTGLGVYGQATASFHDRIDLSAGARLDHERKHAALQTFFEPVIAPPNNVSADRHFTDVSPQASIALRTRAEQMMYVSIGRGFKAGGFNPASPAGHDAYGEEHAWHTEGGVKTSFAGGRLSANAAVFYIDWRDLQLNLPNPAVPAQFYISNVGGATSSGVELELKARPHDGIDVFGIVGVDHARFKAGSTSSGADVGGKMLPSTPDYNATVGVELSHRLRTHGMVSAYGRAEIALYGGFQYDDANTAGQDAYSLGNFRAGIRGRNVDVQAWVRNAFDTRYVPVAFAYGNFAPSGFVGEPGKPRTFGVTATVRFGQ